jgi:hypothetical protein
MSNKKQTALEWLIEQIENKNGKEYSSYFVEFIKQAKEMEKEQIIDAYDEGYELIGYMFRNEDFNKMAYTLFYEEYDRYRLDELGFHIQFAWGTVTKLKELGILETFCEPVYAPKETPISYEEAISKLNETSKVKYTKVK